MKAFLFVPGLFCSFLISAQTLDQQDYNRAMNKYELARKNFDFGQYDVSARLFSEAIALNEYNSDYFFGRATSYYNLNEIEKAIPDIEKAITMEPGQPDYHLFAGNIYFKKKNYPEAIKNYSNALEFQGTNDVFINNINCQYNRGVCYLLTKEYQQAVDDFDAVIDYNKSFTQAIHNRGVALSHLGKYSKACEDFRIALKQGNSFSQKYLDKYCDSE